ncbi:UBP-type zinc finger domain-containing protein [Actinoplanes sp. NEAU-A12]|uniref:UBP-type zinc finger domain-containing protein n=1 Tax=Actinoplanes sandaracinus TaxID=3045177 RepID=A0ABT6WP43_9ACTN|nr:UBP-type zinc finger domain-containing protein [Actinoplanes sandaracinus]MDI6101531.1 UBP-type zinc finger domain-containing protein [Actinoplanes sandaracinus]
MTCQHLQETTEPAPLSAYEDGCPQCAAAGFRSWVHLRLCLSCGLVACCDSSPRRHMTAHHAADGHPVMRSFEPGESWRWCYEDEQLG